jgi:LysM repeat protein
MKILRISGIVIGAHALALILILASPGCSSTSKPDAAPVAAVPADPAPVAAPVDPAPAAVAAPAPDVGGPPPILYAPTRPGTAAAQGLAAPAVTGVTPATTYVVVQGDSLWSVAKRHHLKISELAAANNLRSGATLHLGQRLVIPSGSLAAPAAPSAPASASPAQPGPQPKAAGGSVRHVVRPGETLGAIARHYGVRMGDIATANNISDPQKIRPGQELVIPNPKRTPSNGGAARSAPSEASAPAPAAPEPAPSAVPAPVAAPDQGAVPAAVPAAGGDAPVIKIDDNPPAPAPANP